MKQSELWNIQKIKEILTQRHQYGANSVLVISGNAFPENKKISYFSRYMHARTYMCVNGRYAPEYNFFITYMATSRFSPGRC